MERMPLEVVDGGLYGCVVLTLQPAMMEGSPRGDLAKERPQATGLGKENSSCSGGGFVGQEGPEKEQA